MYSFADFAYDVHLNYSQFESILDEEYNLIIKADGRRYIILASQMQEYYNAFKNSSLSYQEWISRTIGLISQEVDEWYKKWH